MDEILIARHSQLDKILIARRSTDTGQLEAFNVRETAIKYMKSHNKIYFPAYQVFSSFVQRERT